MSAVEFMLSNEYQWHQMHVCILNSCVAQFSHSAQPNPDWSFPPWAIWPLLGWPNSFVIRYRCCWSRRARLMPCWRSHFCVFELVYVCASSSMLRSPSHLNYVILAWRQTIAKQTTSMSGYRCQVCQVLNRPRACFVSFRRIWTMSRIRSTCKFVFSF